MRIHSLNWPTLYLLFQGNKQTKIHSIFYCIGCFCAEQKNITDHSSQSQHGFKKVSSFSRVLEFTEVVSEVLHSSSRRSVFSFNNLQMVDDSGSSCEMCGKKQDFSSSLTTTTSPKSSKPRTHFYFHKSDESSDSNDDLCGDLSWSGEQRYWDGVHPTNSLCPVPTSLLDLSNASPQPILAKDA